MFRSQQLVQTEEEGTGGSKENTCLYSYMHSFLSQQGILVIFVVITNISQTSDAQALGARPWLFLLQKLWELLGGNSMITVSVERVCRGDLSMYA